MAFFSGKVFSPSEKKTQKENLSFGLKHAVD